MLSEDKEITLNLDLKDLKLTKLTVNQNNDDEKYHRINNVELISFDKDNNVFELKYTDNVVYNMKIHLEITALIELDDDVITDDELIELIKSDNADDLAFPLLSEASHIISFITSKVDSIPLIVPPTFMNSIVEDEN